VQLLTRLRLPVVGHASELPALEGDGDGAGDRMDWN